MSKKWLWVVAIFGGSAILSVILPSYLMVSSLYLIFGIFILFSLPIAFYGLCIYLVKRIIDLVASRQPWLTWGIASIVVLSIASTVSVQLNSERKKEFDRLRALDVTLISDAKFTRLVLVDDRSHEALVRKASGKPDECDQSCGIYLSNKSVESVLKPSNPFDDGPFEKRQYAVFAPSPKCDESAIRGGGCREPTSYDHLRVGDLVARTTDLTVPYQTNGEVGERFEIYIISPSGPQLVERRSAFSMAAYGPIPFPLRLVNIQGPTNDRGVRWDTWGLFQRYELYSLLQADFGLDTDLHSRSPPRPG